MRDDELFQAAKELEVPDDLVRYVHEHGRLGGQLRGRRRGHSG